MPRPASALLALLAALTPAPVLGSDEDEESRLGRLLLEARRPAERRGACERLVERRAPAAVAALGEAFVMDTDVGVRVCAGRALRRLRADEAVPYAIRGAALDQPDWVRAVSVRILRDARSPAAAASLAELAARELDPGLRDGLMRALASATVGRPERRALHTLAADERPRMRQDAVRAMASHPAPEDLPALVRLLGDRDTEVVRRSARAMTRLGDPSGVPALREAARRAADDDVAERLNDAADRILDRQRQRDREDVDRTRVERERRVRGR